MRPGQRLGERIEVGEPLDLRGTRLELAAVVRVASPTDLNDERVEAAILRRLHHLRDAGGRREGAARDPERANVLPAVVRTRGNDARGREQPGGAETETEGGQRLREAAHAWSGTAQSSTRLHGKL